MKHRVLILFWAACTLIMSSVFFVRDAHSDALLFPWVLKSSSLSTIISVVNTAELQTVGAPQLHYAYYYKEPNKAGLRDRCFEYDLLGATSQNDVLTFDASGHLDSGQALFNDMNSLAFFAPGYSLSVNGTTRAFLIVDNNTPLYAAYASNVEGTLYGEALITDLSNGLAWGYTAYNALGEGMAESQNAQVSFGDGSDYQGEVIGPGEKGWTVMMPPSIYNTSFFVTPVGRYGQRSANINARVYTCALIDAYNNCLVPGIFLNDESPVSFIKQTNVVCTGAIQLSDLLSAAAYNTLSATGGQAWSYVKTAPGNLAGTDISDEVVIGKLERNDSTVVVPNTSTCARCNKQCTDSCTLMTTPVLCAYICSKNCKASCTGTAIPPGADFKWIRSSESRFLD